MNPLAFPQQLKAMSDRLANLYQGINPSASLPPAVLSSTLIELGIASERLQVAAEMLYQQNQKFRIAASCLRASTSRRPLAQFITVIKTGNWATCSGWHSAERSSNS